MWPAAGVRAISSAAAMRSAALRERSEIGGGASTFAITHSLVYGGWAGAGNIGDNLVSHAPTFARDPDDGGDGWGVGDNDDFGDLGLTANSPCVDTGDNAAVTVATDLAGLPRIVDGDGDGTATVDMGAFELHPDGDRSIPTASAWGVATMTLFLLTIGSIVFVQRRRVRT